MNDQQKNLRTIFNEAVEIESPEPRASHLQRVWGGNPELRQQTRLPHLLIRSNAQLRKYTMKNTIRSMLVAVTAIALLISCSTAKSSIVGKWQEIGGIINDEASLEFFKDGNFSSTSKGAADSLEGKYSFIEDGRIKMEFSGIAEALYGGVIYRVSISGGEMSLTDSDGKLSKFSRAK